MSKEKMFIEISELYNETIKNGNFEEFRTKSFIIVMEYALVGNDENKVVSER